MFQTTDKALILSTYLVIKMTAQAVIPVLGRQPVRVQY